MSKKRDRLPLIVFLAFSVFAVIQCCTFVMAGDDYWWANISSVKHIFVERNINARYLTNTVTYFLSKMPFLRPIVCIPFFIALYLLMTVALRRGKKDFSSSSIFIAFCILVTPPTITQVTTNWISGFTNYVFSIVFSLIYIVYCLPLFDGKADKRSSLFAVPMLILGFIGAFCVENISLYNAALGLFFVIYPLVRFKKVHPSNIAFFIGAAAGLIIMLNNKNYSQIMSASDDNGFRSVEIDFSNVLMTLYVDLLPFIARMYFIVHILIAIAVSALYFRKYPALSGKDIPKYAKIFLPLIIAYALYSTFSDIYSSFTSMTLAFRMNAIEIAFAFLYVIALIYIAYVVFDKNTFTRVLFFICSIVFVTAPFLAVKPVTPRCFFATYIFWVLTAGEFILPVFRHRKLSEVTALRIGSLSVIISAVVFFSIINITNYTAECIRVKYIKQQFEEGVRTVELITLPYDTYAIDTITYFKTDSDTITVREDKISPSYSGYMLAYWGIDAEPSSKNYLTISLRDYFTAHEDE
ncbi:MAG: hypothetical protein J5501_04180 [Ruminococcus sp.]|nr:hypothetical protein [Ruminococcus sp.]